MIYGIDLGTTNTLICEYVSSQISPIVKSLVDFETKEIGVNSPNAKRSFKINMSTGSEGQLSIACSSLVLAEVSKKFLNVKDVVITVPAYFSVSQREATREAAILANLNPIALVNEPTAAVMFYSKDKFCKTLVFDLGGGTFDVSIVDTRNGIFDVVDSQGIVLGGDDLNLAIFKDMQKNCDLKLHKLNEIDLFTLRNECECAKIFVQTNNSSYTINNNFLSQSYTLTVNKYIELMKSTFKKCARKVLELKEKNFHENEKFSLLFVGGSTKCPYLRKWIEELVKQESEPMYYNPYEIVAQGAAYYGYLVSEGLIYHKLKDITAPIGVELYDGSMQVIIPKKSKLPISESTILTNPKSGDGLIFNLYQGYSLVAKSNQFIGALEYLFDEVREEKSANVKVNLDLDLSGILTIIAKEFGKKEVTLKLKL